MSWVGERVGGVGLCGLRLGRCDRGCGLGVECGGGRCERHCESEDHGRALWLGEDAMVFVLGVVG